MKGIYPLTRWARRLVLGAAALALLLLVALASLQIAPVSTWLGRRLLGLAPLAPGVELGVNRVTGSWIGGLRLEGLHLRGHGRELAQVRELRVAYDPRRLASSDRRLRELTIDGVRIHTRRDSAGWDITRVLRQSTDTSGGGSFGIDRLALRDGAVEAELAPDSVIRIDGLGLRARNLSLGETATAILDTVHARVISPSDPPVPLEIAARGAATADVIRLDTLSIASARSRFGGRAVLPRRLDDERSVDQLSGHLVAAPLALEDVAAFGPPVPTEGELMLDARVEGEGRRARGEVQARLGAARSELEGSALLGSGAPADYRLRGTVRDLDLQRLLTTLPAGRLNLDLEIEASGADLAAANGRGDIRVTKSEVGGTAIDDLRLRATLHSGRADVDLRGTVAEAAVRASGWVRPFDPLPSYRLAGSARTCPAPTRSCAAWPALKATRPSRSASGCRATGSRPRRGASPVAPISPRFAPAASAPRWGTRP
jgi:hypothetical protein